MNISQKDKQILQDMAKRQAELAYSPEMDRLRAEWEAHGRFASNSRPMITMELWTFAEDIIPPLMKCEGEQARAIEWGLHGNVVNHTLFGDDTIVKGYIPISYASYFKPFDLEVNIEHTSGLGHHFVPVLSDLEEDFDKLKKSTFGVDKSNVLKYIDEHQDIFGEALPIKLRGSSPGFCLTQNIVHIMSMEDMFVNMCTYPELYHKMMEQLTNDYIEYIELMEGEGVFLATFDESHLGQGSYCFNDLLPKQGEGLKTKDIWCYMDSQESSGVSPQMYMEFVAPYYRRISDKFGRLSYGCCEAVDPIWDGFLSKLQNLGKVSISPWCNEEIMGEKLRGKDIVYLRKPSPNLLGVGDILDEQAVTEHISKTVTAAKGCTLEIAQRDVYSVSKSPEKVRRYVELLRKCCENHKK